MVPLVTSARMRAADEAMIAAGTAGFVLMDRAAHACAVVALRMLGGAYGRRVVVVAGKGNNGGDGIACAGHLARAGAHVEVMLLGEPRGDSAAHLARARRTSVRFADWSAAHLRGADLVVDALLGTGLADAPSGRVADAIDAIGDASAPVLAVDIPSGVSGDDGSVPGRAIRADVTLAIQNLKLGHVVAPGGQQCGRVDVADIGIPMHASDAWLPEAHDAATVTPARREDAHKYSAGAVGIIAGSAGMSGAAILAARAASASGAGIVFLGVRHDAMPAVEGAVTEAVKVVIDDGLHRIPLTRMRALAIGPGIGRDAFAVDLVRRALLLDIPLVVDADALWALGEIGEWTRSAPTVLTPHEGEFTRLTGSVPKDRLHDAKSLAQSSGSVVHLKGRRAVTATPDGRAWINSTGSSALASAGTGDVLTGVIACLLAQGADVADAAWAAAFVHGRAGELAAGRVGYATAGDVIAALPRAIEQTRRAAAPTGGIRTVLA